MTNGSAPDVSKNQKEYLSYHWHDKLARLIARGKKGTALAFLERTIERSLPLFRTDRIIFESRRTAWLIRTHLLLEWNRPAEALAWTCLECQLSAESRDARALRDRLLRQLDLEFDPPETAPDTIAAETQWPGVAGMYEFKAKLERDVILSLKFPDEAQRYGVPLPNGILLHGPPGCGKTFIARKIAEKLGFHFVEVKPGDLASIYVHGTQEKIKALFEDAATKAPTVLFFDELDAFTPKREAAGHHYSAEVNEFLVRINNCANQKILVIGATNFVERVDEAVLRAGRMDLHYYIGPPDFAARAELFRQHLNGRPCARLDYNYLANHSAGYTPADIALIVTQSARLALIQQIPIELDHLLKAMEEHPRTEQEVRRPPIGFRN